MELKLNTKELLAEKTKVKPPNPYESPIRWWKVVTEGDEEGRTIRQLGVFYGHVAEIALSIKKNAMYVYNFTPHNVGGSIPLPERKERVAVRESAHIQLDITSRTWKLSKSDCVAWFKNFLDTDDIVVEESCYYASVLIRIKDLR